MLSVLQNVEGNNIYFRASNEFLLDNILEGDMVICNILIEEEEYELSGKIVKMDLTYPNFVEIIIDDIKKFKNRRKHKRYLVNFQANMYIPTANDDISYAIVKNVSNEGICLISKKHLEVSMRVSIKVAINFDNIKTIEFGAAIVKRAKYGENYNEYGMEITQIDDSNKEMLEKLIYQLEKNESLFITKNLK